MSTDYFPPIQRAVQGLAPNNQDTRNTLYEKARTALVRQLNGADPALTEGQIARERTLLEEAIRRVEHHYDEAEFSPAPPVSERPAAPLPVQEGEEGEDGEYGSEAAAGPQDAEATNSTQDDIPAFAARKTEKRRPQAPRRSNQNGVLKRYAAMAAVAIVIVGGGAATALYMRKNDKIAVAPAPLVVEAPAPAPAPTETAKLNDRLIATPDAPRTPQTDVASVPPVVSAPQAPTAITQPAPSQETPRSPPPGPGPVPLLPPSQSQGIEGQRAILVEEDPSAPMKGRVFDGTVNWRTESQANGSNGPPDTVIVGELNFPERKMKSVLTLRRNFDPALPASFLLQIQITVPADYPNGNIATLKGFLVKTDQMKAGIPLDGLLMRVSTGVYLMGIADPPNEKGRNAKLLEANDWFDMSFAFDNGRNAVVTFEKGPAGEKVFRDAMATWNGSTAAAQ